MARVPIKVPDPNKHRNPNGTYNGVSYFSEVTGLSQEEIAWTAARVRELREQGFGKEELLATVKREAKEKFGPAARASQAAEAGKSGKGTV